MVSFANAGADPRTVVIMYLDASLAVFTVEGTRWSGYITSRTLGDSDFLVIDN